MQSKTQDLAKQLIEVRTKLIEFAEKYKREIEPYELANQEIREQLLKIMSKSGVLSTKYEDFAISRKKSVKAVVLNEHLAVSQLQERGDGRYIETRLNSQALKEIEKGSLALDGVVTEVREYVSIRQAKADSISVNAA